MFFKKEEQMNRNINQQLRLGIKNIISSRSEPSCMNEAKNFSASSHFSREICFVLEGCSRYMINGSVYDAVPGTMFLIDHWETHAFGYRKEDHDLLHLWINFLGKNDQISAYAMEVKKDGIYKIVTPRFTFPPEFQMLISRRWNQLAAMEQVSDEIVTEYMKLPLEMLFNEITLEHHNSGYTEKDKTTSMIDSLKKYIQTTNGRGCSYLKLEQVSGYSRSHLAHSFQKSEGCSLGNYIDKVRVAYTVKALKRGLKQKEIAFELGFSSPANFWLWLRKHKEDVQIEENISE